MTLLFNETVYQTLVGDLGAEDTLEVLRAFLTDTAGKVAELATKTDERLLIKREAHSIKSSAGTFGFEELSALARDLEGAAETLSVEKLRDAVLALQRNFELTRHFAETKLL